MENSSKTFLDTDMDEKSKSLNRAVELEETRLDEINDVDDYQMIHERHRIFPGLFENRIISKY